MLLALPTVGSELSKTEWADQYLMHLPPQRRMLRKLLGKLAAGAKARPGPLTAQLTSTSFDWRTKGKVTPVKNQASRSHRLVTRTALVLRLCACRRCTAGAWQQLTTRARNSHHNAGRLWIVLGVRPGEGALRCRCTCSACAPLVPLLCLLCLSKTSARTNFHAGRCN